MSSRGDSRRGRGSRGYSDRNSSNEKRKGQSGRAGSGSKHRTEVESQRTPVILTKPSVERDFKEALDPYPGERPKSLEPQKQLLLSRKESVQTEDTRAAASSKPPSTEKAARPMSNNNDISTFVPPRNVKLIDDHQFCDSLADYMTDNPDFIVVGVLGTQSVGKSVIMNALVDTEVTTSNKQANDDNNESKASRMFRVQTFEKQMLSEHCTNGVNAWICPNRIIYLDSQPLFSNSVLDRSTQLEKKFTMEFNGSEITADVHSMQLIGLFFSICHVVLVVQEGPLCDLQLIESLKMADLLKPSVIASKSFEEPEKVEEYQPEVIFVHNKIQHLEAHTLQSLREDYDEVFDQEAIVNFRIRSSLANSDGGPNLIALPDLEEQDVKFQDGCKKLKRSVRNIETRPMLNNVKQSEKQWYQHAKKTWEKIKEAKMYLDYSRLLRVTK